MASFPRYPSLFEINTRVWLDRLSREAGRPITYAALPPDTLRRLRAVGGLGRPAPTEGGGTEPRSAIPRVLAGAQADRGVWMWEIELRNPGS